MFKNGLVLALIVIVPIYVSEDIPGCQLSKVNAFTGHSFHENLLEVNEEKYLEISYSEIPVLCNGTLLLPKVVDLIIVHVELRDLMPGCLDSMPNLRRLEVTKNNVTELRYGVFNGLDLEYVSLRENGIVKVHRRTFDDMPSLRYVNLENNSIKKLNKFWFSNCPQLYLINFDGNEIGLVPKRAFQNLNGNDHVLIYLRKNRIRRVQECFANFTEVHDMQPKYVHSFSVFLNQNQLACVPYSLLDACMEVNVMDNPLSLECMRRLYLYEHYISKISLYYY